MTPPAHRPTRALALTEDVSRALLHATSRLLYSNVLLRKQTSWSSLSANDDRQVRELLYKHKYAVALHSGRSRVRSRHDELLHQQRTFAKQSKMVEETLRRVTPRTVNRRRLDPTPPRQIKNIDTLLLCCLSMQ